MVRTKTVTKTTTRTATAVGLLTIAGGLVAAGIVFGEVRNFNKQVDSYASVRIRLAVTAPAGATTAVKSGTTESVAATPPSASGSPGTFAVPPASMVSLSATPSYCRGTFDPVNGKGDLFFDRQPTADGVLRIRNSGTRDSGTFELRIVESLRTGGLRESTRLVSSIRANAVRTVTWEFASDVRNSQFTLDSAEIVDETNECNNIADVDLDLI